MKTEKSIFEKHFVLEEPLRKAILNCPRTTIGKGKIVVKQNSYIRTIPMLLEGSLRVYKQTEDREILYYYLQNWDMCGLTLGACLEGKKVESEMISAQNSEIVFIPSLKVKEWQQEYPSWNSYLIQTLASRQQQLLDTFGQLAFSKMEKRITDYLKMFNETKKQSTINITHQELANELGTTRVVISRILKTLEISGAVELLRGAIRIKKLA